MQKIAKRSAADNRSHGRRNIGTTSTSVSRKRDKSAIKEKV